MKSQASLIKLFKRVPLALFVLGSLGGRNAMASASTNRISSIRKDLSSVQKIYLHAGLSSVMAFPKSIIAVRVGNPKSVKVELSPQLPNEITVFLTEQAVEPTNLIVTVDRRVYVFDIIPSKKSHQDYIRVAGFYGSPEREGLKLLDSRTLSPTKSESSKLKPINVIRIGG